jgi:predicted enzyme related to lactoylglutathione lyase
MFKTVLTAVQDLDAAKATWSAVLGAPTTDSPYYVGWTLDGQEIGLTPSAGQPDLTGPTPYWHTDDIEKASDAIVGAGGSQRQAPQDVGGGRLVALVADAEGNQFGLIQDPA